MKIKIEFEIDDNKYRRYDYCLEDFLNSLHEYKVTTSEVVIKED